jgi:hypothetical protein
MPALTPSAAAALVAEHGSIRKAAAASGHNKEAIRVASLQAKAANGNDGLAAALTALARAQAQQTQLLAKLASKPLVAKETVRKEKPEKPVSGGSVGLVHTKATRANGQRFVITGAQNNTDVHPEFLATLLNFCEIHDAQLMVGLNTYNRAAWGSPAQVTKDEEDDGEVWFDPSIQDYAQRGSIHLAPDLAFCAELDILPTAADPLSGLDSYTRNASGIVAHPRVGMKPMPRMPGTEPRHMWTTGYLTQRNYIPRKMGQKAEFHHTYGAIFVEIDDDGVWFAYQLVADENGTFCHLNHEYGPDFCRPVRAAGLTLGDVHIAHIDPDVASGTIDGPNSVLNVLQPGNLFIEDLIDFEGRNHHNIKDPHFLARMHARGRSSVEQEMGEAADFLRRVSRPWCETVVVESNHDKAFSRWLKEADGHRDPPNARYWHKWNEASFAAIERDDNRFSAFEGAVREKLGYLPQVRFLRENDSFQLLGIECGMHGHNGVNGARANPRSFRALGTKCTTAHTHSPQIVEGVYVAGTMTKMDLGYNVGPTSWAHAHVVTYANGKRAVLLMRGRRWRARRHDVVEERLAA